MTTDDKTPNLRRGRIDLDEDRVMARVREQISADGVYLCLPDGQDVHLDLAALVQGHIDEMSREAERIVFRAQHGPTIINLRPAKYTFRGLPAKVEVVPAQSARAPGALMLRIADFFCSPKTYRVIEQTVADLRYEHSEAIKSRRIYKARWVVARYWFVFGKCLFGPAFPGVIGAFISAAMSTLWHRRP